MTEIPFLSGSGGQLLADALIGAGATITACLVPACPPMAYAAGALTVTLGVANFGSPLDVFSAADNWRDNLGGFEARAAALKEKFLDTNEDTWIGTARDEFDRYLARLRDICKSIDGAASMMYNELQWFALALVASDAGIVAYSFAAAAAIVALMPGLVPAMESAPAIGFIGNSYLIALGIFAGEVLLLEEAGRFLQGNIRSAIEGAKAALWREGQHDVEHNNAIIPLPKVQQWRYDPILDGK